MSASVGIALSTTGHDTPTVLLRNADAAMYRAKERGRGGIELYDLQDDPWTVRRLRTGNDLHRALERNEFELHYQPFVDLHTIDDGGRGSARPLASSDPWAAASRGSSSIWPRTRA